MSHHRSTLVDATAARGLNLACQTGRHSNRDRGVDLYETPTPAVEALLRVEQLPHRIWEPACGRGAIVKVLRAAGHDVVASDLIDYGAGTGGVDFLKTTIAPAALVLTNPPFKIAAQFAAHGLKLCPRVILLLRLAFYESEGRTDILEHKGLARIHVFRNRLPMMHRDGWTGRGTSSAMAFAWFVWERGHRGKTETDRISWVRS